MKKLFIGLSLTVAMLAACGDDEAATKKGDSEQEIAVDKGLLDVELTLPADLFEGQTEDEIIANAKEKGVKEVKVNEDGTVYYKMSKSEHKKMMKDAKQSIVDSIAEIVNSDEYSSIKEISYNKDFTEYDITVDQNAFNNSMDGFAIFSLAISSTYYNGLDGKSDDLKLTMNMIDEATGEEYDSFIFPDDLEDEENTVTE
ncbi:MULTISPECIES: hypothetical protein [unclassified Lysinibacillus]|uniref:hypothetical protein n=1 Tax=unclassified Lysinibacillus TaxID=2636778 RepID=UPI001F0D09CB|nr:MULTISPECIES: hypothetical protein [unclassified Lysinibacillus]